MFTIQTRPKTIDCAIFQKWKCHHSCSLPKIISALPDKWLFARFWKHAVAYKTNTIKGRKTRLEMMKIASLYIIVSSWKQKHFNCIEPFDSLRFRQIVQNTRLISIKNRLIHKPRIFCNSLKHAKVDILFCYFDSAAFWKI